jgi:hypothetical protein
MAVLLLMPRLRRAMKTIPISETMPNEHRKTDRRAAGLSRRSSLHGLPRAVEIADVFQNKDTHCRIAKVVKGQREIWDLMLAALDGGIMVRNKRIVGQHRASLRMLFPNAPLKLAAQIDLRKEPERAFVRDLLLPAMIADRKALLKNPNRLVRIMHQCGRHHIATRRQERHKEAAQQALSSMPSGQPEVIMFGERLWPRTHDRYGSYDFEQLTAAVWTFREFETALCVGHRDQPQSRGILIRHSTKFLNEYCNRMGEAANGMRMVLRLVHLLTTLMVRNPDAECRPMPAPAIDG